MANKFTPDYAVHPGETLSESLEVSGMTQVKLADRTGLSRKTINGIINGKEPLTHQTALQLEKVFRVPAKFWVSLQANYDEAKARIEEKALLESYSNWIKDTAIPYAELAKRKLVPETRDKTQRLEGVLSYFGVSTPEAFNKVWGKYETNYSFRKSEKAKNHFGAIAAWLRQGELDAENLECKAFNKKKLLKSLDDMRSTTILPCEVFQELLIKLCAECGIALVFVPGIKGAPIYGATRWVSPDKAVIQLSLRGKDDGNLWFTFFHEIGHVLKHGKSEIFLEIEKAGSNDKEEEANEFARNLLIPKQEYTSFVEAHQKKYPTGGRIISKKDISDFAKSIGVPPGVVVGRLQCDKHIPYTHCNKLKQRFEFCDC